MKFCTHCGKEIADEAVICLNCGCSVKKEGLFSAANNTVVTKQIVVEEAEPSLATWAKICGIVSFFVGWFVLGIIAIVFACASKDDTNGAMCPSARVGYICGIVSTVLSFLAFVLLVAFFTAMAL